MERRRITIAILGLGGQGGGVLADWIVQLGEANGYVTQATSVPGVAQRTGSTVYYVELIPAGEHKPVLALMPMPGDVDIVIASELMEAGRAVLRGFVTDRTTLIASTHRVYAIAEKTAMGDGRASGARILEAARTRSGRFIGYDMEAAAVSAGSVISSVQFGALAASGALPFERAAFEAAIRAGGKAVEPNLRGFATGFAAIDAPAEVAAVPGLVAPRPTSAAGQALAARIAAELPAPAHAMALEGVRRLMDYQDAAYAGLYLDRLRAVAALDRGADGHALTCEAARHLALWMAYEDTIRVADLKVRATRMARVRDEVRAGDDQLLHVIEYMHPRLEEVCETLPARLGAWLLASPRIRARLEPWFSKGRHVETTGLRWFVILSVLAAMRRRRRGTLRYAHEQARIETWLAGVMDAAQSDPVLATEMIRCQRLIKGYGDTFARGLRNFDRVMGAATPRIGQAGAAARVAALRTAALGGEDGQALDAALAQAR